MGHKDVTLRLGPDHGMQRIVRLAASSLAADVGFTVHEIEDLTLAVNELTSALFDVADGDVEIMLRADKVGLTVRGRTAGDRPIELSEMASSILDQAADLFSVEDGDEGPSFSLVKVHAAAAG